MRANFTSISQCNTTGKIALVPGLVRNTFAFTCPKRAKGIVYLEDEKMNISPRHVCRETTSAELRMIGFHQGQIECSACSVQSACEVTVCL